MQPKPTYVIGFPTDTSVGKTELLVDIGLGRLYKTIEQKDSTRELAKAISTNRESSVTYGIITDDAVEDYFRPFYGDKEYSERFGKKREHFYEILEENYQKAHEAGYPHVEIGEDHSFTISTLAGKETFYIEDLFADYGKKNDDYFLLRVEKATTDACIINFSFSSTNDDVYHLFMTQDLSTIEVVNGEDEALGKWIASGMGDFFSELIFKREFGRHYSSLTFSDSFYDHEKEEIVHVDEDDRLSANGEYVYIDGNRRQMNKGKQRLQATEHYLAGNTNGIITFPLNPKQMAKEYGLKGVQSNDGAQVIYFNEDYVMYKLHFKAFLFGAAGRFNVIVDLQEDPKKPVYYLFGFGIS